MTKQMKEDVAYPTKVCYLGEVRRRLPATEDGEREEYREFLQDDRPPAEWFRRYINVCKDGGYPLKAQATIYDPEDRIRGTTPTTHHIVMVFHDDSIDVRANWYNQPEVANIESDLREMVTIAWAAAWEKVNKSNMDKGQRTTPQDTTESAMKNRWRGISEVKQYSVKTEGIVNKDEFEATFGDKLFEEVERRYEQLPGAPRENANREVEQTRKKVEENEVGEERHSPIPYSIVVKHIDQSGRETKAEIEGTELTLPERLLNKARDWNVNDVITIRGDAGQSITMKAKEVEDFVRNELLLDALLHGEGVYRVDHPGLELTDHTLCTIFQGGVKKGEIRLEELEDRLVRDEERLTKNKQPIEIVAHTKTIAVIKQTRNDRFNIFVDLATIKQGRSITFRKWKTAIRRVMERIDVERIVQGQTGIEQQEVLEIDDEVNEQIRKANQIIRDYEALLMQEESLRSTTRERIRREIDETKGIIQEIKQIAAEFPERKRRERTKARQNSVDKMKALFETREEERTGTGNIAVGEILEHQKVLLEEVKQGTRWTKWGIMAAVVVTITAWQVPADIVTVPWEWVSVSWEFIITQADKPLAKVEVSAP